MREAQALARLSHPNVVTVFEADVAGDIVFVAMELVDGTTLSDWMREPHRWDAIVDMFIAAGRGLAAAHELGLIHRDFKPSNVLLDRAGTPKVGDFGVVAQADPLADAPAIAGIPSSALTAPGAVVGTPSCQRMSRRR